jgi:hypothetical protein
MLENEVLYVTWLNLRTIDGETGGLFAGLCMADQLG